MSTEPRTMWICNGCGQSEVQSGPRAMAMPQVPPKDWVRVDLSWLVPAHSEETPQGRIKVGDALDHSRYDFCPRCRDAALSGMPGNVRGATP